MSTRVLIICTMIAVGTLACESASSTKPIITPVLDALRIETSTTSALVGDTVVVKAVGTLHLPETPDDAFERDMTALVQWVSSNPEALLPSPDGRARAKDADTVTLTAKTPAGDVDGAGIESDFLGKSAH